MNPRAGATMGGPGAGPRQAKCTSPAGSGSLRSLRTNALQAISTLLLGGETRGVAGLSTAALLQSAQPFLCVGEFLL